MQRAIERASATPGFCLLVNDVTAIAWALPLARPLGACARLPPAVASGRAARRRSSPPGPVSAFPGLIPTAAGDFAAIEGEGGHQTLAAQTPREWAIVAALVERFGHASAERALSGPGIEAMWKALASMDGTRSAGDKTAAEIARDAFAGADSIARETIATFTGFLGSVAGDLDAHPRCPWWPVYIAGGIVPGWDEHFDAGRFLDRFRAKGRFRNYLSAIPVHVVTHPCPGLVGVEHLLSHRRTGGT